MLTKMSKGNPTLSSPMQLQSSQQDVRAVETKTTKAVTVSPSIIFSVVFIKDHYTALYLIHTHKT